MLIKVIENIGAAVFVIAAVAVALMLPYPFAALLRDGVAGGNLFTAWCGAVGLLLYTGALGYAIVRAANAARKYVGK